MTQEQMSNYYHISKEVRLLEEELENLTLVTSIPFEKIGSNPNNNTLSPQERNFKKQEDLVKKKESTIKRLLESMHEIEDFIESIEDSEMRTILRMKYINRCKTEYICRYLDLHRTTLNRKLKDFWEEQK